MWPGVLKRALAVIVSGAVTVTFAACVSTEDESAKIERDAQVAREHEPGALKLGATNPTVRVTDVTLLRGAGRGAVAMKLTSSSTHAQRKVPVLVEVEGGGGKLLYSNQPGGTDPKLQHVSLLGPHEGVWWVNDQVLVNQPSKGVKVRVGTGSGGRTPDAVSARKPRLGGEPGANVVDGELVNEGSRAQHAVPVYAVALRGGKVVAAGSALVASLAGHKGASAGFHIQLVGDASNAKIELSAVPAS
ncbi:MAG TPA: hypothetical protein VMB05_16295 [Solirubrobacteraceae bacterium]|nr:hypothetical protein [Solirubrobacteraceae bacterium]